MHQQMNLLDQKGPDPTAALHGSNPESKAAWESLDKDTLEGKRWLVYNCIERAPNGATCEEVEQETGLSHQTASARCTELKHRKLIVIVGRRPTSTGRTAAVYKVAS